MSAEVRLREHYCQVHFSHHCDCSPAEYERLARFYRYYYRDLLLGDGEARILDVGCGAGHFLYFLKSGGYRDLAGIDGSDDQVEMSRLRASVPAGKENEFVFLRAHPGHFDVVTANHVIEHIPREHLFRFVEAKCEAARPGGRLIVTVPNAAFAWASYLRYADLTHQTMFADQSLCQLFGGVGISNVELYRCGPAPTDWRGTLRWLMAGIQEQFQKWSFSVAVARGRGRRGKAPIVTEAIIAVATKPVLRGGG